MSGSKPEPYWVIKTGAEYWLEEGGVTRSQKTAERFSSKEKAQEDLDKWCFPQHRGSTRVVKVVRRGK